MKTRAARLARNVCGVAGLAVAAATLTVAPASAGDSFSAARSGTAQYHNIATAKADGFGELKDKNGIACIDNPAGGMGIHYVLGSRVGDPTENAGAPEVLVYEPQKNGQMKLVAVEYVVLKSSWEGAGNTARPSLFGQTFELVPEGNRYGLPDFYELHAWIWEHNPSGMNEDWNPKVSCDA
ncbi:MAG: hypothetical protein QOK42_933 [Frankiaceae bacterium]|jgi:hypothetical protein|nr:hypothetical protein [Frankiaceae bacterium]MDX6274402.1 hypothetical protein [Frankiales bacterium]